MKKSIIFCWLITIVLLVYTNKTVNEFKPDIIIGSSMGGYTAFILGALYKVPVLAFNPALHSRSIEPNFPEFVKHHYPEKFTIVIGEKDTVIDGNKTLDYLTDYIDKYMFKLFKKEDDLRVCDAINILFKRRENLEIFNKKALYIYIREMTDVDTPVITKVTKKLKILYKKLYNEYIETGYVKI